MALLLKLLVLIQYCFSGLAFLSSAFHNNLFNQPRERELKLFAIQVKIYGTSNAYTTLRPYDVVIYELEEPIEGKKEALGLYLGGVDEEMRLLCCGEMGGYKFHVDHNYEAMNAQALQTDSRIRRVITANRVRDQPESVMIEEWLSSDIYIPIGDGKADCKTQTMLEKRGNHRISELQIDEDAELEKTSKLTLENFDAFLLQRDASLEQRESPGEALMSNESKVLDESKGGATLNDLEREVLKLEEQITTVLGMISRLKARESRGRTDSE